MTLSAVHTRSDAYPTRLPEESWRERQDPVVWGRWTPEAPLTRAQTEAFAETGFLVLENLFTAQEIDRLRDESLRLRSGEAGLRPDNVVTEPGSDAVRTIFRLEDESPFFNRVARDARVAGVVQFLLDDALYLHQSRLNYKPGFTGKEFYWHSDFETWHAEDGMPRPRACSASIALTPNRTYNGPLMIMPGTQKYFVQCAGETPEDYYKESLVTTAPRIGVPSEEHIAELYRSHGLDVLTGPAGSVTMFDCNALHASGGNITPMPRANEFVVFNSVENQLTEPYAGTPRRPDFLAHRR